MKKFRLGDLLTVKHGWAFKGEFFAESGQMSILTPGNFFDKGGFKRNDERERYYTGEFPSEYLSHKSDLIVAMTEQATGLLGSTAIVPEDDRYLHNQRIGLITCNENIDKMFAYYLFMTRSVREQISRTSSGTKVKHTSPEKIYDVEVIIPDISMQKKIAHILWSIDMKIECNTHINDNLFATTQAIYKSWFVDFEPFDGICPRNWLNGCVDDIAEFYDSMRKPLSSLERADMERIYPYYGAVSIVDYVDDFIFDGEYLLVSEDGIYVVDENGHPLLQHITGKFWANNHAHILKGKAGFNEDSLYLFLENTNMAPIVTGAAQPKINQANLKSFPITIPTSDVIEKFNALIQPFFDQRLSNEAQVKKLENLKDLLLSRLVN